MTITTIEQFREQCTDAAFAIKREQPAYDMDQYVRGWNAAIDEAVSAIAALPLPVMPSQDVCKVCNGKGWVFMGHGEDYQCEACSDHQPDDPVMPEQAEPVTPDQAKVLGYIAYTEKDNVRIWYRAKNHNRALEEASENTWTLQPINIDEENTALLARVAELEARITQIKDQFAKYEASDHNNLDIMIEYNNLKELIESELP